MAKICIQFKVALFQLLLDSALQVSGSAPQPPCEATQTLRTARQTHTISRTIQKTEEKFHLSIHHKLRFTLAIMSTVSNN